MIAPHSILTTMDQDAIISKFQVAGVAVSVVAIFNLLMVRSVYGERLGAFSHSINFRYIMFMLSLVFLQRGGLNLIRATMEILPGATQDAIKAIPGVGEIMGFSEIQLRLFFSALTISECLVLSVLHFFTWPANEKWYGHSGELKEQQPLTEETPLLLHIAKP